MKLLNIGCGNHFHPDWINIDLVSSSPYVKQLDIRQSIPYPDDYFDAVYHSHLLEHLAKQKAFIFMKDCFRVLKPNGIIRVVIPDLENIIKQYLYQLNQASIGASNAENYYDWIMLELLDQIVRRESGGEMKSRLANIKLPEDSFIIERIGLDAHSGYQDKVTGINNLKYNLELLNLARLIQILRAKLVNKLLWLIIGKEGHQFYKEATFLHSGENHLWMYDRYSLGQLFDKTGFNEIKVCRADESRIPNFNNYELDVENKIIRKPDSLFMEGVKPLG